MRVAVIDLGTNTFHLLIASIREEHVEILYKTNVPVKLGEGKINENIIVESAFNRGIDCLVGFKQTIQHFKVSHIRAVATSAVRSAKNGLDFITQAKKVANINIDIISGEEEADLIYQAVKLSGAIQSTSLIMDIGGGSVEFILCNTHRLIWKKSYNVGAARLMQQFFLSDPLSDSEKNAIIYHIQNELKDLFALCEIHRPEILIGVAGAFETFATLLEAQQNNKFDAENTKVYFFEYEKYIQLSSEIINSTHAERAAMPQIIPLRVDLIVMATLLTNYVLGSTKISRMALSTFDLKMGLLQSFR